ncbi:hypothetical protein O181_068504 [Austropuccinia psidii MF-1]|uniref:Reverse transcriptase domain-containing protein n=1 Tax=Austropuccinia psidii MF-1 TaxID=1389203 RepID=A0A9Q3I7M1_9BASI|nr:hypothetical protein [Austropuccinia psidii MF-1]
MLFGIKNAPSHFQIMMNEIFPGELLEGWLIIYIDDIIVCSKTWKEHIYRLSRFLTTIQSVSMKICLKKFYFGFEELKALGHAVSGLSLGIDKNKVAAVLLNPMPQNKKEIQSFLGFAGYYRQHNKDFASIERPLHKLCDKDTVFVMTVDRVKAFESLRQSLTTAQLLLIPDFKLPFKLYLDASGDSLGASLHQVHILNDKLSQPQRLTLLHGCCGNSNQEPSWGQLATPYPLWPIGPLWCSMAIWPYPAIIGLLGQFPHHQSPGLYL